MPTHGARPRPGSRIRPPERRQGIAALRWIVRSVGIPMPTHGARPRPDSASGPGTAARDCRPTVDRAVGRHSHADTRSTTPPRQRIRPPHGGKGLPPYGGSCGRSAFPCRHTEHHPAPAAHPAPARRQGIAALRRPWPGPTHARRHLHPRATTRPRTHRRPAFPCRHTGHDPTPDVHPAPGAAARDCRPTEGRSRRPLVSPARRSRRPALCGGRRNRGVPSNHPRARWTCGRTGPARLPPSRMAARAAGWQG
jgi:hypothetical protein